MSADFLDFPTIEAPPPPVAPPVRAIAAVPAPAAVAAVAPSIKDAVLAQFADAGVAIRVLTEKYRDVAYDVTTTKGMSEARAARLELREKGRFAVQRAEKSVKSDVNDLKRLMADEVERLVAIVQPVEGSIDAQIKAEENRKAAARVERERMEAERIAGHQASMDKIAGYLAHCQRPGMTAERIQAGIDALAAATFGPDWQEFAVPAADLQRKTLDAMRRLHDAAVEREAEVLRIEAARQAEAARLDARRVEQARVAVEQEKVRAEQAEAARVLADQAAELKRQTDALAAQQAESARLEKLAEDRRAAFARMTLAAATAPPPAHIPEPAALPPPAPEPMMQDAHAGLSRALAASPHAHQHAVEAAAAIAGSAPPSEPVVAPVASPSPAAPEGDELAQCRAALADACNLLDGWIVSKCPKQHTAEHFAHVAKLRDLGGLPRPTTTKENT